MLYFGIMEFMNLNEEQNLRSFENAKANNAIEGLELSEQDSEFLKDMVLSGVDADTRAKKINEYLLPQNQIAAE